MDVREKLIDLKPCPFCGGEAIAEGRMIIGNYKSDREYSFVNWIVRCTNRECFMSGLRMSAFLDEFLTEEEAIEAWNRRAGEEDKHEAL